MRNSTPLGFRRSPENIEVHYARVYKCAVVLVIVGAIAVSCIADVAIHLYGLISRADSIAVHDVVISILPDLASVGAAFLCCIASRCGSDSDYSTQLKNED